MIELPKGAYLPLFRERGSMCASAVKRRTKPLVVGAGVAAVATIALLAWRATLPTAGPGLQPHAITFDTGWTAHAAVSPDGRLLAFASDRGQTGSIDIWIRDMEGASHGSSRLVERVTG